MIEYVAAIVLSFLAALVIRAFGLRSFQSLIDAISQLVGGWRPPGWPRGVQEEDRDTPWGRVQRSLSAKSTERSQPRPQLTRVQPSIRSR